MKQVWSILVVSVLVAPLHLLFVLSSVSAAPMPAGQAAPTISSSGPESSSKSAAELICSEGVEMGTAFRLCVFADPAEKMGVQFDLQKSFRKLAQINAWMSDWISGTELNKINEAAGARAVPVRKELFDLIAFTREVSEQTEGAFDPTFNAFWGLYSFKSDNKREPTDEEVRDRLPLVNYKNVELNIEKRSVFLKKSGMKLGLGGIGQGYGVDAVVADLKKRYKAGFVDGSGDTYFWGVKPSGELWLTSIRDPRDKSKDIGRIYGTDFAITTAGDDEKFFLVDNRRVHHILDPKTGRPSIASRQVTVIAPTATEADAFDTATFVMGAKKGQAVLENRGLQGIFVSGDHQVTMTKGLKRKQTPWGEVLVVENQASPVSPAASVRR